MEFDFVIVQENLTLDNPIRLAKNLQKRGCKVGLLIGKKWRKSNGEKIEIENFYNKEFDEAFWEVENHGFSISKEEIKRIKDKYNINSIRKFYFTHLLYLKHGRKKNSLKDFYELSNDYDDRECLKKSIFTFQFLENFLDEHEVKRFLSLNWGGSILRRALIRVANHNNIPYINGNPFPIKNHFTFLLNEDDNIEELDIIKLSDISKENVQKAKNYLQNVRKEKEMYIPNHNSSGDFFKQKIQAIKNIYYNNKEANKSILETFLDFFSMGYERTIKPIKYSSLWEKPNYDEDYYFFPLHYHCESILGYRNPQFWRQEWLAEYVARVLPQGYKLYVKTHPSWKTSFPYQELKKLSKISNIRLIYPVENSHKMIRNSSAVVVISNTTGFEAIIHKKPVISLGKSWYRGYGLTIDVDNLWELDKALNEALDFEIKEEEVIRFLASIFSISYKGKLFWDMSEEDINNFTEALFDFIGKRKNTCSD